MNLINSYQYLEKMLKLEYIPNNLFRNITLKVYSVYQLKQYSQIMNQKSYSFFILIYIQLLIYYKYDESNRHYITCKLTSIVGSSNSTSINSFLSLIAAKCKGEFFVKKTN